MNVHEVKVDLVRSRATAFEIAKTAEASNENLREGVDPGVVIAAIGTAVAALTYMKETGGMGGFQLAHAHAEGMQCDSSQITSDLEEAFGKGGSESGSFEARWMNICNNAIRLAADDTGGYVNGMVACADRALVTLSEALKEMGEYNEWRQLALRESEKIAPEANKFATHVKTYIEAH